MADRNLPTPDHDADFLEQKAFRSRFIVIAGEINSRMAAGVITRLIALSAESEAPINLLLSSPGGHVESGDAIHDVVRFVRAPVNVIGAGWVASAATHIYLAVPRERRFSTENTRFLIHQPSGGGGGTASDIAIQAREIVKMRERIATVIARETGQPIERVREDIDRDYWMSAAEALDYGIVGRIVAHQSELPA